MKRAILSLVLFFGAFQYVQSQTPVLGSYPASNIAAAGGNTTVIPSSSPINATRLTVNTSSSFKGLLNISPVTGIVTITDAHPAGTYIITVKAYNGVLTATGSFTLTVNNTACSQGLFSGTGNVGVGSLPYSLSIGDFNNDGKQDLATTNYGLNTVSIRMGDGNGGFTGITNSAVGTGPQTLAIGDLNGDGKQDIAVVNSTSFNISILLGNGTGGFTGIGNVSLTAGSFPYSLVIGDFNGDGKQDLATANYNSNSVSVLLGDGIGGFGGATNISVGNGPRSLAIGDFNSDGKLDLVTANYLGNSVSIRLGNGLGGFSGTGNIAVGSNPHSVSIGDFNADGKQDLVTANINNASASVRLGDGLGNFTGATEIIVGADPRSVAIGDFNGDGKQDIATTSYSTNTVSIRLGDGTGGFSGSTAVVVQNSPYAIAIGDFNADGKQDIATANAGSSNVSIRLGTANDINVTGNNSSIVDGDNTPALADHTDFGNVTNNLTRNFTIQNTSTVNLTISSINLTGPNAALFTIGNMVFPLTIPGGASATLPVIFVPTSIGLKGAQVNIINDNCNKNPYDFAIQGTGVILLSTLGTYPASSVSTAGGNITVTPDALPTNTENITAYTTTNFRGLLQADPLTGVVTITNAHPAGTYIVTVKANGVSTAIRNFTLTVNNTGCSQGLFSTNGNIATGAGTQSVAIGDFNHDGIQDLALANSSTGISVYIGNASGGFAVTSAVSTGGNPQSIAIGDFNGDGKQDLATANSSSNDISIRLGNGSGGFSGNTNIPVGTNPLSIVACDFNADGKQDLAVANFGSNTVTILLGDGLAGFTVAGLVTVGSGPRSVIAGDFNGDGKQDLVVANYSDNNLFIRLGDGLGGFSAAAPVAVGTNPYSVTTGDFNGDGKQDLATSNYTSNNISISLGNGSGNFGLATNLPMGNGPVSIATGDFNGDGKQDIATANNSNNNVSIRLGDGLGNFGGMMNIPVGTNPASLAIGDLNADGKQDIVTANTGSADISIRFGSMNDINVVGNNIVIADGDDTPAQQDHTDFGNVSSSLIRTFLIRNTGAANLTINNIVITGVDSSMFSISDIAFPASIIAGAEMTFKVTFMPTSVGLKGARVNIINDNCNKAIYDFAVQGTGVLLLPTLGAYPANNMTMAGGNITVTPVSIPVNAQNIAAFTSTDFKGLLQVDATTGVVTITNAHPAGNYLITVKAYGISSATSSFMLTVSNTSCSQGTFISATNVNVGANPFSIAIGDFNGDGRQDIATANYSANNVSIRLGDGFGNFSGTNNISVGNQPFSIAIGDFNADGKQDLATANYNSGNVSIRLGDGFGNFSGNTEVAVGNLPTLVTTGDFNADGKQDLAVVIIGNNSVSIRLGDGTGNFNGTSAVPVGTSLFSIAVGDFNHDGKQDFATANYNISTVGIHLGDGLGGFNEVTQATVGINPYSVAIGDFNGDGKQDIATANYNSNNVSVCLGDGTGNFSMATATPVGNGPGSLTIGDFNGDGKQDIATANYLSNNISIRLGDGLGNFNGTLNMLVGTGPESLATGDLNADGKQDLVVANNGTNNVSVRLGIANEINVKGNNVDIADGDSIPGIADYTDFAVGNNTTRIFTIQNTGNATLTVSSIAIAGTHASLFTVNGISLPVTIPTGGSATFSIHFVPVSAGLKKATVIIGNDDCDEGVYDFAIQGTFDCPQVLVSFTGLAAAYCSNAAAVTLTGSQSLGAVFTGAGITNNGNGTAIFNPLTAGIGVHTINYVYTDGFGCTHSTIQSVTVNPLPVVSFSGLAATYFVSDVPVTLTGNPAPNGIFAGPGITTAGNGTAVFAPATAGAGVHSITYTYADINGCSNFITQQVLVNNLITLNLKLFLQGYYTGGGTMQPVLNNQDVPLSLATETDTITVELHNPATAALIDTKQAVLLTNGTVSAVFTQTAGLYYIAIRHRSTVQTWSADPVFCTGTSPLYNFSSAGNKAFADNQVEVEPGIWAFYTGDLNQDEFIDGNDFPEYDNDIFNGVAFEYKATDFNGDGFVDGNDFPVFDNNSFVGITSLHP